MYRSSDNPDTVIDRFSGPGEAIGVVWVCHCPDDNFSTERPLTDVLDPV